PMALGVEAAGVVARTGGAVTGFAAGDRVMTHSLPLRAQGGGAEWFVAAAADVAAVPDAVPFEVAAALPGPALTADQVLHDALGAGPGATVLVNGAGGVTGMLLVALARHLGAEVIATAGAHSAARVSAAGAAQVLDRRADWPGQVRALTGGRGADLAANAAPRGAARTLGAGQGAARVAPAAPAAAPGGRAGGGAPARPGAGPPRRPAGGGGDGRPGPPAVSAGTRRGRARLPPAGHKRPGSGAAAGPQRRMTGLA